MLFMGEEWAASTPFQFFTSHPEPELGKATAEGRIAEFERMGWDPAVVPDPQDPATFERSKLDWAERRDAAGTPGVLDVYRRLAALRRERRELTDPSFGSVSCTRRRGAGCSRCGAATCSSSSTSARRRRRCRVGRPRAAVRDAGGRGATGGVRVLPAHAGALLGPVTTFS